MKKQFALALSVLLTAAVFSGCGSTNSVTVSATPTASYPQQLSKTQLGDFEKALGSSENYGFLLSDYDDVTGVDLTQVLYNGAGMTQPENAEAIVEAEAASLDYVPDCDSTVLTTQQISDFLESKTGHSLSDMKSPLSWDYVGEYDAYVHFHGDTNFVTVSVDDGNEIAEDTYEIKYTIPGGIYDSDANLLTGGTVTVKASGASMQFISNKLHS